MNAISPAIFVADDPVLRVANTWADHFKLVKVAQRKRFIDNYVQRCKEHRFWSVSAVMRDTTYAICRLADNILFFNGTTVQVRLLNHNSKSQTLGTLTRTTTLKIPSLPPDDDQALMLVRTFKRSFATQFRTAQTFDSMTTFSKAFRKLVDIELSRDVEIKNKYGLNEKSADARFIHPRKRYYNGIGSRAMKSFIAHLNADIVKAVRSVGCPSYTLYNWMASGNVERRIQAVRAFPLLLPYVLLSDAHDHLHLPDIKYSEEQKIFFRTVANWSVELGRLVDEGQRIQPVLSIIFGHSEKIINTVNTYRLYHTGSALSLIGSQGWDAKLRNVFRTVGLGNKLPKNRAEWRAWTTFLNTLPYYLINIIPLRSLPSFLAGCPAWNAPEWDELLRKAWGVRDMDLNARFGGPTTVQPLSRIAGLTLKRLLNLSDEWHAVRDKVVQELSKDDELNSTLADKKWPAFLNQSVVHEPTSIEVVELAVPVDLFVEGQTMRHCVDGYGDACYSGRSRIVSLRKDGKPLATAEFRLKPWKKKPSVSNLYVAQLSGVRNARISDNTDEGKAFAWFLRQVKSRSLSVNLEWPNVPYHMRPVRMRNRDSQVKKIMRQWLFNKLNIPIADIEFEVNAYADTDEDLYVE